jgi:hypothetical protein
VSIEARSRDSVLSSIVFSQMRSTIGLFSFKCLDMGPDIGSHRDPIDAFEWHALTTAQTASYVRRTGSCTALLQRCFHHLTFPWRSSDLSLLSKSANANDADGNRKNTVEAKCETASEAMGTKKNFAWEQPTSDLAKGFFEACSSHAAQGQL